MELSQLPQINFAEKSVAEIESSIFTVYESLTGKKLYPGDPVRLFLKTIATIIIQQRALIDFTGKQNLLAYAASDYLDHIGILVGTSRLPEAVAVTTLRFTLSAVQPQAVTIPQGTRATTDDNLVFITTETAVILTGQTFVDVKAVCTETGIKGNGYEPGQINKIVDPLPWLQSITNITISEGGADLEGDAAYRERIHQAPEKFSTAGPDGAYEYWAKSAHQSIIDVAVYSPVPGEVEIRPLLVNGELPGEEILNAVEEICNDKTIRPLTDKVTVLAPETVNYDIDLIYFIDRKNAAASLTIKQNIETAMNEFVSWQKSKLGRDINPSELIAKIMLAGAKRVEILSPVFTALGNWQAAIVNQITAAYGGLEDG